MNKMKDDINTTDEGYFIMKWGKFISLIIAIVVVTNFVTGFMLTSEFADEKAKVRYEAEVLEKLYIEARTKRRIVRILEDSKNHVHIRFLEKEVIDLKEKLKQCK